MDTFNLGLMLGRVLELSEGTAAKVDTIEARQTSLLQRIDKLESAKSQPSSSKRVALAFGAALAAGVANLKAEQVAEILTALLRSP